MDAFDRVVGYGEACDVAPGIRATFLDAGYILIFVGYAAEGSLARKIIDGHKRVRIDRHDVVVRSHIWTINGFSAHAGQSELLAWLGDSPRRQVMLVHGEEHGGMEVMQQILRARGVAVACPTLESPCRLG
jgi:metallo-beta-lactamase family protein